MELVELSLIDGTALVVFDYLDSVLKDTTVATVFLSDCVGLANTNES